jgi:hypothetical protein
MAYPPYMNSTGLVTKIFGRIADAQKPERFTQDYLANVLGYSGGSARPIIPLLKRLNFLQSDGTPTQLYARIRNPSERASAMLEGLKVAYGDLYARSEYAHMLPKDKLRDLVVEVTGIERDNQIVNAIVGTFQALKIVGGVNDTTKTGSAQTPASGDPSAPPPPSTAIDRSDAWPKRQDQEVAMNLSYTINLNLPPSSDPAVFNAIFKALKEHLLGKA